MANNLIIEKTSVCCVASTPRMIFRHPLKCLCLAFVVVLLFCGCEPNGLVSDRERKEKLAIEAVQNSESSLRGLSIIDCLFRVLKASKGVGKKVTILGWDAEYTEDGSINVWFRSFENSAPFDFHWKVVGKRVVPADEFTQRISKPRLPRLLH